MSHNSSFWYDRMNETAYDWTLIVKNKYLLFVLDSCPVND